MKGIVLRALLFFLPILGVLFTYIILDPFKVIGLYANYKPSRQELSVPLNQNRVSAGTYLFHEDSARYDSFIFGSSRSMFYEVDDWREHIGEDARCYHFDASAETLEGILHKIQFLQKRKAEFKNVLLILDVDIFRPYTLLNEHLYMEDPLVVGWGRWLPFQSSHFMAFMDRKFLRAYVDYNVTGKAKPYMSQLSLLDDKPFSYDSVTNELCYSLYESQGDAYYTAERMSKFKPERDGKQRFSAPVIHEDMNCKLQEMADMLLAQGGDVRIVISPLYNQVNISPSDLDALRSIFGETSVFDFSGINGLTSNHTGYYERSHYRTHIAKAVLDSIYEARPH
jgi:hypothetical protein